MGISRFNHRTGELFPSRLGSEGLQVLKGPAVANHMRGAQNTAELDERFFVDLILGEQV
jgi:hypothetical protein